MENTALKSPTIILELYFPYGETVRRPVANRGIEQYSLNQLYLTDINRHSLQPQLSSVSAEQIFSRT